MAAVLTYQDNRWFKPDNGEKIHDLMLGLVKRLQDDQMSRLDSCRYYATMYGNVPYNSLGRMNFSGLDSPIHKSRLQLNVVKSCITTMHSKITKNRPKISFLTDGGDYDQRLKAELLEKFADGVFYEADADQISDKAVLDAGIYGTGIVHFYEKDGRIRCERVFPWEMFVEDLDGMYQEPRSLFRIMYVDRLVLAEKFPGKRKEIMEAPVGDKYMYETTNGQTQRILVTAGWHLRSSEDANDGVYAVCIDGATLAKEKYENDKFPFAFLRWTEAPFGFWGDGIAKDLFGLQLEINHLLRDIQRGHHLIGKAHWMVHNSAEVPSAHINNDMAAIIRWSGNVPPQVYVPQAVSPDTYNFLNMLYQKSFEITGLSQLSAQSQKPSGLNSGRALREFHDIETERFMAFGHAYEQFRVDMAEQAIALAKNLSEEGKYSVRSRSKSTFERIEWKDIDLDADSYVIKAFPVSSLSSHPAARRQEVEEMLNSGLIDPETGLDLLDFPDTEKYKKRRNSPMMAIESDINAMLKKGEPRAPEPLLPMEEVQKRAQYAYLEAKNDGAPEDRLTLLRNYISVAVDAQVPKQPPAPPGGPMLPNPGPPMNPGDMPVQPGAPQLMPGEALPVPAGAPAPNM